jgi:uncharacterized phage infection (PIP) family protein YhgE
MRKNRGGSLFVLLLVLALVIVIAVVVKPPTVCEKPLAYDVGVIDNKFNITQEEFLNLLKDAENIWEEGMGMDLFTYKPGADFKINLIFDERQRKTIAEKRAREALEIGGGSYETLTKKYQSLLSIQKSQLNQYDKAVSSYTSRLSAYNDEVAYYNRIGGAPKKKYNELERDRAALENDASSLEQQRNKLNALNRQLVPLVDKINNTAGTYNTEVSKYNRSFGAPVIFDQGEYTGDRINIYQFDKKTDLRVVLAHEFGHSMNLDHVENPTSIMYYLMEKQDLRNPKLSEEDINALKTECGLK